MTSSALSTSTPFSSGKSSGKASKPTKVITLQLSPKFLARFPSEQTPSKGPRSKSSSSSASTPALPLPTASPSDNPSESNSTPAPTGTPGANSLQPPADGPKRKGVPGPKPGTKRGAGALATEGLPKARAKPGPKKRVKLEDGTATNSDGTAPTKSSLGAPAPATAHKLGPKANQGAINAGLRALDRSGKPCRKWERKGFQIKSFTGVAWHVPSWRSPKVKKIDIGDDLKDKSLLAGSSDSKADNGSSAVESEKSNSGGDIDMAQASSPVAAAAITA
ncbi:MAG: hypothetical protein M1827_006375 [Pycnora praestabilis]|nr:MAG: hypothetical protein M1827_006375 [Pycnora praestabilis]